MSSVKIITSIQRRRRWSAEDKQVMVEKAELPSMSISYVAMKYDVNPSRLFRCRRLILLKRA